MFGLCMFGPDENVTSSVLETHGVGWTWPSRLAKTFTTGKADLYPHRDSNNNKAQYVHCVSTVAGSLWCGLGTIHFLEILLIGMTGFSNNG